MSSDETLTCVLCKEAFIDKETLQEHFRKHGDRNFDLNTKLQKHKNEGENADKMHVTNELVQCDVCEEEFPTISKAITHKHKAHPDHNTKYFCSWCGKLFTMKHLYKKHYINHQNMEKGEDVFHCDHCDVDFYKVSAMLYHNKSVHRDCEMPDIGHSRKQKLINQDLVIVYYCPFCGEENINKVNVNKHISDDHSGEDQSPDEVLRCPLCDAIFYHLDAYEAHLTYHSPDDIYNGVENLEDAKSEYSLDTVPPVVEKVEDVDEATGTLENLLEVAGDDSSEKRKFKKKHKKHKKSKKETITLDEFLSMSDVFGGEGLDIHGIELVPTQSLTKTFKAKPRPQVNKKPMSQIDKLKQQGIIVRKANSKGNVPKPRPKIATLAKVSNEKSSSEALSKLLNQSCNQLVISKKPGMVAQNVQDLHKDLSSPDLINKSHESLEVECDLLPCSSSDIDQSDAINNKDIKDKDDKTNPGNASFNSASVESNSIINEKLEHMTSVQNEIRKSNSMDILKSLSHLITVKSVSKPDGAIENDTKENFITSKEVDESEPRAKKVQEETEGSPYINCSNEEKKIDSRGVLEKVSQQITVKPVAKPNINKEGQTPEETLDENYIDDTPNAQIDNNVYISDKSPEDNVKNKLQSTYNQDSNIKFGNKKPEVDILKGLGQNIVIKSSPKQFVDAANTSNDVSMLNCDDLEKHIKEAVIVKKSTTIENKTLSEPNSQLQTSKSNSVPDVIKNLCKSITIKSNNSNNSTIQKSTHDSPENSDVDEDYDYDTIVQGGTRLKQNCDLSNTKPITEQTPIKQPGAVKNDQKLENRFKSIGQNIIVKSPSLKLQNTDINSLKPNSTNVKNSAGNKTEADKNLDVFKNLSKHITVKSSKPLATSSENEEDYLTDGEQNYLDSNPSKPQQNKANQVVIQNISQEITIKQSSPKPQNAVETKILKNPCMVNRAVATSNMSLNKGICTNTEIYSIEDSDSDDIDAKKSSTIIPKHKNSCSKVDIMDNRTAPGQVVLPSECLKLRNISVKPVPKKEEINNKPLPPVLTDNMNNDVYSDLDFDETEPDETLNNSVGCKTQKLLMNNKNITIKSSNSAQTKIIKNMSQKMVKVSDKSVTKIDNEFSDDEDNLDFSPDSADEYAHHKETLQRVKNKPDFGKESVVDSFKDFDSDSNEFSHEDDVEDAPEDKSNSLINKLKNINKNLSIKSNNPTIPSISKKNIEQNAMKRNLVNDTSHDNSHLNTAPKLPRGDTSKNSENNKQPNNALQVSNNQIRTVNHQASTSSTNKVQQKVTTSVRRIETETVVEEITTTVTRTIKTVNQTVNKQVLMSGSQTNVVTEQPLRFATPTMVSGPRPHQIRSIQGTRVRAPPPDMRPKMRPTRPVLANNIRLPTPPQRLPCAPRMRQNAPFPNVAPANPVSSNQQRGPKPLRVSPKVMGQLSRANQSFNKDDRPGHFSCFRKPTETVTPLNEFPASFPAGFSSVVQESNFSNKKVVVKSDGGGTSQVRSEVSSSAHQQIKKVNMTGVKVAKRSMVQQVCTMEQREVSSANRSTMDAIERLQRSGLLIKKPRIEEAEEEMNYNSEDDEVPHGGPLLAIEDGT